MQSIYFTVALGMLVVAPNIRADDSATAKALTELGAKVVLDNDGNSTTVTFADSSKLGPAEFKQIGTLTKLKSLTLFGQCKGLTDETLPLLKNLKALEVLLTDRIVLSDDGFRHFDAFDSLKTLSLFHVSYRLEGFTGAGFRHLKDLPKLTLLTIGGTSCTDEALAALAEVTQLQKLRFYHTFVGPEAAGILAKMTHLKSLEWGQSLYSYNGKPKRFALTDETIPALSKMKNLESLALAEARLSGKALAQLAALGSLKKLTLRNIDIAADDVAELQKTLKGVEIVFTPQTEEEKKKLELTLAQPKLKK